MKAGVWKMNRLNLVLMFGGNSGEHEVSLMSASSVARIIDKEKYNLHMIGVTKDGHWKYYKGPIDEIENNNWRDYIDESVKIEVLPMNEMGMKIIENGKNVKVDVVFPVMHGPNCEDGKLQGFFETCGIKYVGCDVLSSALAMDKISFKRVLNDIGIDQVKYDFTTRYEYENGKENVIERMIRKLGYPMFTKPSNMGSSVGIKKCTDRKELEEGLEEALKYDDRIVVEEGINPREIEIGVLGNHKVEASIAGEIIAGADFYDYEDKYIKGVSRTEMPADLSQDQYDKIRKMAIDSFGAIGGRGLSRVDFFIDKADEKIYLNEINTMPGFTSISMYPKLWEKTGMEYSKLVDRLIELALEK